MKAVNGGKKTTLKQQFELAFELYKKAYPDTTHHQSVEDVIEMIENTLIGNLDSLVSWTGIQVDWFLNVFCQSPFMKVLIEYGCKVWFIRKICVIEMVRRTADRNSQGQPNGTFVENIQSVVKGWNMVDGDQGKTSKPTTFISYTGAYTMEHVVRTLAMLDPEEYVWMDIFCVNQFAWTGKGRTKEMRKFRNIFMDDLQKQIKAIGNTALILEQWDNVMLTLGQMWVMWEIFNTAQAQVELNVLLTPGQRANFIENCLETTKDFKSIQASLATIDANNALTADDIDRQFILDRMQREDRNLVEVNTSVLNVMRKWLAQEGLQHLSSIRKKGNTPSTNLLNHLGLLMRDQGNLSEAEPLFREALATSKQISGDRHPDTFVSINNLGILLHAQGKLDEAAPLLTEALATSRQVWGDQHPKTLFCISNFGMMLLTQGKLAEAESPLREALETRRQVLGNQHQDTLSSISILGELLKHQGNLDDAAPLYREALTTSRQVLGNRHPNTLLAISNLAVLLQDQGRFDDALVLCREALSTKRQVLGNRHPDTLISISNLGMLLKAQGKFGEAAVLSREALGTRKQVLGNRHPDTLISMNNLAALYLQQPGKPHKKEAFLLLLVAVQVSLDELGASHPYTKSLIDHALKVGFVRIDNGKLIIVEDTSATVSKYLFLGWFLVGVAVGVLGARMRRR